MTDDKTDDREAANYDFSSKQIEGLSALGQHLAEQIRGSSNLSDVQAQAHQVDPMQGQAENHQSVFRRVGEAQQTVAKRAKYEGFITQLSKYE